MSGAALALRAQSQAAAPARASRVWWLAGAGALLLAVTVQPFRDPDVWWHLALGRYIVEHGIPAQEPFSFLTAGNSWVNQQWLYEVGLFRVASSGAAGPGLASLLMGGIAVAALVVAALAVPRGARVSGAWLAAAMLISGLVMAEVLGVRGQVITLLGTAILLLVITRWREGSTRALWALPPVLFLWANLHAGFIVGLLLLLIAWLFASSLLPGGRVNRRAMAVAIAVSALATMLNPAGPGIYRYVAETFLNPTLTSAIVEWQSPDFHNLWLRLFEAQVMLLVLLWAISGGPRLFDLLLAGVALAATLQAQRNVSLFAIVALPQIAFYGSQAWRLRVEPALQHRRLALPRSPHPLAAAAAVGGVAAAVAFSAVLPNTSPASASAFEATRYPRAAAGYVAAHLAGKRLYTVDIWGGYLAYRFPQGRVVFLYGETGAFGAHDLQLYESVHLLAPDWTGVLQRYHMQNAVVPLHSQEASAFHALDWTVDCYDSLSSSVVMSAPSNARPPRAPALLDAPSHARRC
jgi:hypothetical protein